METIGFSPGVAVRNCFRCGKEFRVASGSRVCSACRKPRLRNRKALDRSLSMRDKQIITLVRQAKLNKEIAHELHLTEGTIKEYMNRIFRKTGVKNRTELAVWWMMQENNRRGGYVA